MNSQIEHYLAEGCGRCPLGGTPSCKVHNWTKELNFLRTIVNECGLKEELKWSVPCYTFRKKNVLIIAAFKEYASLSFFKGSLLQDSDNILVKPGENSQSSRLVKFTDVAEIEKLEHVLRAYIYEAIELEKNNIKVDFKAKTQLVYPEELIAKFNENTAFKTAFEQLTPGRQRGYILHFTQPVQLKTRESRISKCIPWILEGKGFHDK